ncbi:hypothetical protein [Nocardioides nanhaiensis]|uniref:Uncharacterized protein n=1 Tax=Nocardioides nanhaiensis TaxID=1476871 RepID=A0ABP8WUX2_9ACTN
MRLLRTDDETSSDPLFAALRRRHPDVDVVLLPPEEPAPTHRATEGDDAEVRARLAAVELAQARVRSALAPLVPDLAPVAAAAPAFGGTEAQVRGLVRLRGTSEAEPDLVHRLASALSRLGWAARVAGEPGAVGRVTGVLDDVDLSLTHAAPPASGLVLVVLTGPPLTVGVEAARRWVAGEVR